MSRFSLLNLALSSIMVATTLLAQSPTPSPAPSKNSVTPAESVAPTPSRPPSSEQLVNSLTAADLQAALGLIRANFAKPDVINETDLNRATLQGLMVRLGHGVMVLPDKASVTAVPAALLYGEILDDHIGYLRAGSLNSGNLQTMDKKMIEFSSKKVDALIIDLRASSGEDFGIAGDFARRLCPKGKTLFTLRKAGKPDRPVVSDRDPTFQGLMFILVDGDTAGGAEAMASAVRDLNKALIIGQPTAGSAVEYSDLPLPSGKILRVAASEVAATDGHSLYPQGIKPDLPVEMPAVEKRQVFQMSVDRGMGPFVYETERPHFNEAALMAGTNPELESAEQRRNRPSDKMLRDAVAQRALDLITSLEVYQKR
jgi:hypothetical protein